MQLLCDWPIWIGGKKLLKLHPICIQYIHPISAGVIAGLHVLPTKCFQVADEEVGTIIWMTNVNVGQQVKGFLMEWSEKGYYECKYKLIYKKNLIQTVNIFHGIVI